MRRLFLVVLVIIALLPLQVIADGKSKQRRSKPQASKVKPKNKKSVVRKTSLVSKRKRSPVAKKPLSVPSNVAEVFSYCHSDTDNLSYTIYFKKVFTEAVKIGYESDPTRPNWKPAPNGWEGLKDYKVLKALYDALEPTAIDVYPGSSSANSAMVNNLVIEKKKWTAEDIAKANLILEAHIRSLGFIPRIDNVSCGIYNMRPSSVATIGTQ